MPPASKWETLLSMGEWVSKLVKDEDDIKKDNLKNQDYLKNEYSLNNTDVLKSGADLKNEYNLKMKTT